MTQGKEAVWGMNSACLRGRKTLRRGVAPEMRLSMFRILRRSRRMLIFGCLLPEVPPLLGLCLGDPDRVGVGCCGIPARSGAPKHSAGGAVEALAPARVGEEEGAGLYFYICSFTWHGSHAQL